MKITLETEAFSLTVEVAEDEYVHEVLEALKDWRLVSITRNPPVPNIVFDPPFQPYTAPFGGTQAPPPPSYPYGGTIGGNIGAFDNFPGRIFHL